MSEATPFTLEKRKDGVAVIKLDTPDEPLNVLKLDYLPIFHRLLDELAADPMVQAVVFSSGKPDSFLAGADVKALSAVKTAAEGRALSRDGQAIMNRVAEFRAPFVAAIHGVCLGGGLELSLACAGRVCSDDKKTKLGLPEVQLGLLPGAGGTQRLPRLIGLQAALDLMLTGKQVDSRKAKKLGLVDEVAPAPILIEVAARRALALANDPPKPISTLEQLTSLLSAEKLTELGLEKNPFGRRVVFDQALAMTRKKTYGNYPAPERILEVTKYGLDHGLEKGLEAEADGFGDLTVTPEARQLMGIYFAHTALKKDSGTDDDVEPREVNTVAMLGAGLMGSGIAYVTGAFAKTPVRLKDREPQAVARGLKAVRKIYDGRVKRRRLKPRERDQKMALVSGTTDYSGFEKADVVIEAVFEDLELKRRILKEVEAVTPAHSIFASNTSSLPIKEIAAASARPEQVIGMHYFSPVEKMPLLEIIVTDQTAPWVTATCVELGKQQGKTVIVVRDGVGFYTSRILGPYMNEAAFLLTEGVKIEAIDKALVQFGFPVGPMVLLDEVGIDVGEKVGKILHDAFGDRLAPPAGISKLRADDRLGRKNGRGVYLYDDDKKSKQKQVDESVYRLLGVEPTTTLAPDEIAWRCSLQMVNEAVLCFEEGILRSARDGDIGAVFGLGFPPFRGGPFRLVDALGAGEVLARLEAYAAAHGPRFEPAALLRQMAAEGQTFHGENAVSPRQPARA